MSFESKEISDLVKEKYQHGFVTEIEQELVPPGLDEDVVRLISRKKGEPAFPREKEADDGKKVGDDALPHTATGKLLKAQLREEYKDYVLPTAG